MHFRWEALILSADAEWHHALAHILAANGVDSAYASSIEDCKEIVAREYVGLIFWDSHLADWTYKSLLQSIWSLDRRVKIVVVSHLDDWNEHLVDAREGAFGVIPFPYQPADIDWILNRALRAEHEETQFHHVHEVHYHF